MDLGPGEIVAGRLLLPRVATLKVEKDHGRVRAWRDDGVEYLVRQIQLTKFRARDVQTKWAARTKVTRITKMDGTEVSGPYRYGSWTKVRRPPLGTGPTLPLKWEGWGTRLNIQYCGRRRDGPAAFFGIGLGLPSGIILLSPK